MTSSVSQRSNRRSTKSDSSEPVDELAISRAFAMQVAEILTDTPASETLVIDIHEISSIADFFLVCTGDNERQVKAIMQELIEKVHEAGIRPSRVEGTAVAGWIVVDFGDLVVHVFSPEQREYYRIEDLWDAAPRLLSIQ